MDENTIAKTNMRDVAENTEQDSSSSSSSSSNKNTTSGDTETGDTATNGTDTGGAPDMGEMGGPMGGGGGMPGEMTIQATDTNEWLVPMTAAGIVSGTVIVAAVVVCLMMFRLEKKLKKD